MKFQSVFLILGAVLLFLTSQARAELDLSSSQTTLNLHSLQSHFITELWGNATGGELSNPAHTQTPASDGTVASAQGLNSAFIGIRYKVAPNRLLGIVQNFNLASSSGQPLGVGDLALSYKQSSIVETEVLHVHNELQLLAPTSAPSVAASSRGGVKNITVSLKDLPGTRLTLGLYSVLQYGFYSDSNRSKATAADAVYIYQAPFANYRLSAKTAATLWIDLLQIHEKDGTQRWSIDPTTLKPGFSWDVNKSINLNPYVSFSARGARLATSFAGVFVSMKI